MHDLRSEIEGLVFELIEAVGAAVMSVSATELASTTYGDADRREPEIESQMPVSEIGPSSVGAGREGAFARVQQYIDEHYGKQVTIEQIARGASLSVTTMRRLVRSHTGHAPYHAIRVARLREAKRLLAQQPYLLMQQVADQVGISAKALSRACLSVYGASPRAALRHARG